MLHLQFVCDPCVSIFAHFTLSGQHRSRTVERNIHHGASRGPVQQEWARAEGPTKVEEIKSVALLARLGRGIHDG
jgi:hypothetical protein